MRAARLNTNVAHGYNGGEIVDLEFARAKGWLDGKTATEVEVTFDEKTKAVSKVDEIKAPEPAPTPVEEPPKE